MVRNKRGRFVREPYDKVLAKKALGMLKELSKRIENGELIVESSGFWASTIPGKYTFQVHAKESETFVEY